MGSLERCFYIIYDPLALPNIAQKPSSGRRQASPVFERRPIL
jgi:hypothetical protein